MRPSSPHQALDQPAGVLAGIVAVVGTGTGPPNGVVEVTGDGGLAGEIRAAIGTGADPGPSSRDGGPARPACIVETTGRPEVIRQALARLAELGLLVLAGPPSVLALDLYPDVHVRGLRLVGVPYVDEVDRSG